MTPRFYFTLHRSDLTALRILPGAHVMLVAAGMWRGGDNRRC